MKSPHSLPLLVGRKPVLEALEQGVTIEKIFLLRTATGTDINTIKLKAKENNIPVSQVPVPWTLRAQAQAERSTAPDLTGKASLGLIPTEQQQIGASAGAVLNSKLPGKPNLSVPPALDSLGTPKPNQNPGLGAYIDPFRPSSMTESPTLQLLGEAGKTLSAPPTSLPTGLKDRYGQPVELPLQGKEQQRYQQILGSTVQQIIQNALHAPDL